MGRLIGVARLSFMLSALLLAQFVDLACAETPPTAGAPSPPAVRTDALGDPLPAGARMRLGTLRLNPPSSVLDLAISPNQKRVVTFGDQLIVWDSQTGKEIWRADLNEFGYHHYGSRYGSRTVTFSADNRSFFTTGQANQFVEWNTETGERAVVNVQGKPVGHVGWSHGTASIDVTSDEKKFAIGSPRGVTVCDRNGKRIYEVDNSAEGFRGMVNGDRLTFGGHYSYGRFSPDGTILAVVTSDRPNKLRLHDAQTGAELRIVPLEANLVRLAFSPDSKQIAATERDSAVRLYEVATGKRVWSHTVELKNPHENYTSDVAFSPDGKMIAIGATDHRLYLIDAAKGEEVGRLEGHHAYPWTLAFSSDSQLLYSAGWEGPVRRWDVAARKQLQLPAGVYGSPMIAASPHGELLAYQDDQGGIHLVDTKTGADRKVFEPDGTRYAQLLFSNDGKLLAAGGSKADQIVVNVRDLQSGKIVHTWNWSKGNNTYSTIEALSFSPDNHYLAAAAFRQGVAYVCHLQTDLSTQLRHSEIFGLSFSPDGKTLATAGWDSKVRFWDTSSWKAIRTFEPNKDAKVEGDIRIYAVCYAPTGGLIATGHMDSTVRVWQASDMKFRSDFKARFSYGSLAFSPDGLWLAAGDFGNEILLADAATGSIVWKQAGHLRHIYTVVFGRDSRTLVSGADDGVGFLWNMRPLKPNPHAADPEKLWTDLAGEDAVAAYSAMWSLAESPDRAVQLISDKLRDVRSVVDPELRAEGVTDDDHARSRRLKKLLAAKDPKIELCLTYRRATTLLAQLGSPAAKRLLEQLATRDPEGELSRIARESLRRLPTK